MKIAILGTRGVPPAYGGFETFAAELGVRLVARGHDVTVYCRSEGEATWKGIRRIVLPSIGHKYFETVSHTFFSALDALRRDFDAVLLCNAANAFTLPLLRAGRFPVAINVDGIERKRRKWNVLGRGVYLTGEAFSVSFADRVVADADVIADYYRTRFGADPVVIPYGAEFPSEADTGILGRLGLAPRRYILYVSRFEPENNPLEVARAYRNVATEVPLVMVGAGLYARELEADLQRLSMEDRRPRLSSSDHPATEGQAGRLSSILLPGAIYGADYRTLQRNALFYIQATEVGGTHPAMIEAMASGGAVLAHETPENREVGGDAVGYFRLRPDETLSETMREWILNGALRESYREKARQRAAARYNWESVTSRYEQLFEELAR